MDMISAPSLTRVPVKQAGMLLVSHVQNYSAYTTPLASQPSSRQNVKRAANGTPPKKNNCSSERPLEDISIYRIVGTQDHPLQQVGIRRN